MPKINLPRLSSQRGAAPDPADLDTLAAQALGFLAADPRRLQRFVDLTGLDLTTLRQAADTPGFTMAILAFMCDDEPLLVAFAKHIDRNPASIGLLVQALAHHEAPTATLS